jgi:hypothetical protein
MDERITYRRGGLATLVATLLAVAWLALPAGASALNSTNTFDANAEGWKAVSLNCLGDQVVPAWAGTGGNPGGFIQESDSNAEESGVDACPWFLLHGVPAPNLKANYGGSISIDVFPFSVAPNRPVQAQIASPDGKALVANANSLAPVDAWSTQSFQLSTSAPTQWHFVSEALPEGREATLADFFDVLEDVNYYGFIGDLNSVQTLDMTRFDNAAIAESPSPLDSDGDGVPNTSDQCPAQAGPVSNSGCPAVQPPADQDGDGVPDATDQCPTEAGPASNGGCPKSTEPPVNEACEKAKKKLKAAKAKLKKLKANDASAKKIKKAKAKVKKAKAAVKKSC